MACDTDDREGESPSPMEPPLGRTLHSSATGRRRQHTIPQPLGLCQAAAPGSTTSAFIDSFRPALGQTPVPTAALPPRPTTFCSHSASDLASRPTPSTATWTRPPYSPRSAAERATGARNTASHKTALGRLAGGLNRVSVHNLSTASPTPALPTIRRLARGLQVPPRELIERGRRQRRTRSLTDTLAHYPVEVPASDRTAKRTARRSLRFLCVPESSEHPRNATNTAPRASAVSGIFVRIR